MPVKLTERDITASELEYMKFGFEGHERNLDIKPLVQIRHSIVATDGFKFGGAISALANGEWFYITDLWVETKFRGQNLGSQLLTALEAKAAQVSVKNFYAWTASYEAPEFYKKNGYKIFCELENYYPGGQSRLGVMKKSISARTFSINIQS